MSDRDNKHEAKDELLEYDKLNFYYMSLPVLLFGNYAVALFLSALMIGVVDNYSIGIWILVGTIMFLYGIYHYYSFSKLTETEKSEHSNEWLDKYYTDTLLNGIVWGSSAFLIFPTGNMTNQLLLIFFLYAVGFLAMGVFASKKDMLITYVSVMYLPIILRLLFWESDRYNNIAYILIAITLVMMLIANYYGKVINNGLLSRRDFVNIKQSHEKLKERFLSLFERAPVSIYYYNKDMKIEDANENFLHINDLRSKNELSNISLNNIKNNKILKAHSSVFDGKTETYKGPYKLVADKDLYVKLSTVPLMNNAGEVGGGVAIINDITSEVNAKEKMIRNSYYDMLTNVPNRTLMMDKLIFIINSKKDDSTYGALIYFDIDNFKKINESYGHDMGDNLLKQVAGRIEDAIKKDDTFARVGGDKFAILISSVSKDEDETREYVGNYIRTIKERFVEPLKIAGDDNLLSFSIGIMIFNNDQYSAFDILKRSETAMYAAKESARGTVVYYENGMDEHEKEKFSIANDIRKALSNNEFHMVYQPQIDIKQNKIVSVESLIRWEHPSKGNISPSIFIPIAEESGIIIDIENWTYERVFSEMHRMKDENNNFLLERVAVNVSTVHFMQPNFVEEFTMIVSKHNIDPKKIELEITESGVMRNIDEAIEKIKALKEFGFTFAIDDFGTGYSSLAYLKKLPVDMIKVDKTFVDNIHTHPEDAAITSSVIYIGGKFGLKVLSEGVEEKEVLDDLSDMGCDLYQGYYGYKPLTIDKLISILQEQA